MAFNLVRNKDWGTYPHATGYSWFPILDAVSDGTIMTTLYGKVYSNDFYSFFGGREYDNYNAITNLGDSTDGQNYTNSSWPIFYDKLRNLGLWITWTWNYLYKFTSGWSVSRVSLADTTWGGVTYNQKVWSYNRRLWYLLRCKGASQTTYMEVYDLNGNTIAYWTFTQGPPEFPTFYQTSCGAILPNNIIAVPQWSTNHVLMFRINGTAIEYLRKETSFDFFTAIRYTTWDNWSQPYSDFSNGKVVFNTYDGSSTYYGFVYTINSDGTVVQNTKLNLSGSSYPQQIDDYMFWYADSTQVKFLTYDGNTTLTQSTETVTWTSGYLYNKAAFIDKNNVVFWYDTVRIWVATNATIPTLNTNTSTSISKTWCTANWQITATWGRRAIERGICYKNATSPWDPTTADSKLSDINAWYNIWSYSKAVSWFNQWESVKIRSYAINDSGTWYWSTITTVLTGWLSPTFAYADDANYTTIPYATNWNLNIEISKNWGSTWTSAKTLTFTWSETSQLAGNTTWDNWWLSLTGDDMWNSNFRVRINPTWDVTSDSKQIYGGFWFTIDNSYYITWVEISVKWYWNWSTFYINHIKVRCKYGTTITPVIQGSMAYASDCPKNWELVWSWSGNMVFWDGNNWIRLDSGTTVGFNALRTITAWTTNLTDTSWESVLLVNASWGAVTINLPPATSNAIYNIKCIDWTNTVTVNRSGSDTIFTTSSVTSVTISVGHSLQLVSNKSNQWNLI